MHRNLRPTAILIADNGLGCVSDFAHAGSLADSSEWRHECVNEQYMGPLSYRNYDPYSFTTDVFAFGYILYKVVFRRFGGSGGREDRMRYRLQNARSSLESGHNFAMGIHKKVLDLIDACCSASSEGHPSFSDIVDVFEEIRFQIFDDVNPDDVKSCIPTELLQD